MSEVLSESMNDIFDTIFDNFSKSFKKSSEVTDMLSFEGYQSFYAFTSAY